MPPSLRFSIALMAAFLLAEPDPAFAQKRPSAWSVTAYDGRTTAGTTSTFNAAILTITCRRSLRGNRYDLQIRRVRSPRDLGGDSELSFIVQSPDGRVRTIDIEGAFIPGGENGMAEAEAPFALIRALRAGERLEVWIADDSFGADGHLAGQFRLDGSSDAIAEVGARCR